MQHGHTAAPATGFASSPQQPPPPYQFAQQQQQQQQCQFAQQQYFANCARYAQLHPHMMGHAHAAPHFAAASSPFAVAAAPFAAPSAASFSSSAAPYSSTASCSSSSFAPSLCPFARFKRPRDEDELEHHDLSSSSASTASSLPSSDHRQTKRLQTHDSRSDSDDSSTRTLDAHSIAEGGMSSHATSRVDEEFAACSSAMDSDDVVYSSPVHVEVDEQPATAVATAAAEPNVPYASPAPLIIRKLSSDGEIEVDTDQWRHKTLQVNDSFQPLLNQISHEQAKRAAGFDTPPTNSACAASIFRDIEQKQRGNMGRAVWNRFDHGGNNGAHVCCPTQESALAHALSSSVIPAHQSMVLYTKPTRPPMSICQIEELDDSTAVHTPAAASCPSASSCCFSSAASSASSASSSAAASAALPSAVSMSIRPGVAHAGWKRRRPSEDAELPLYSSTVQIEELEDSDEQLNKRARLRSGNPTPPSAARACAPPAVAPVATPSTPSADQAMCDSLPPSPIAPILSAAASTMPSTLALTPSATSAPAAAMQQLQLPPLVTPLLLLSPPNRPSASAPAFASNPLWSLPAAASLPSVCPDSARQWQTSAHAPPPLCASNSATAGSNNNNTNTTMMW